MVLAKKNGPPALKKGGKKGQGMKTGKNFVRGNKGPRPLMSLRPGPIPRGPPGFMRPGPFGPPPGVPGPFFPPPPMMGCPPGPPGMFPHGPGPQMWGGPMGPMGPPPFRGPMVPPGPPGPMGGMRRGPAPLIPPPGVGPIAGPPGPRRVGPGPIRTPVGKNHMNQFPPKDPEPKIDFTEDTIDIQLDFFTESAYWGDDVQKAVKVKIEVTPQPVFIGCKKFKDISEHSNADMRKSQKLDLTNLELHSRKDDDLGILKRDIIF